MVRKYNNFLNKSQETILSAAFILAVASGINALLGFVKGRLLATFFGDSEQLAIFYTADRIPDLIYSVLVVGALSTVFIPVFTSLYQKNKNRAWETASSLINISILFFIVLGIIIFVFAPSIINLLALGKFSKEEIKLGANVMRIMLSAQLILVVSSFITSILQSFKFFLIPALAPIAYNLGLIFGIVALSEKMGIYGPAIGVVIGAFLHLIVQLPMLSNIETLKFSFKSFNIHKNGSKEVFELMPSRIGSVLINNLVSTINNSLAILISTSAVVHLKFASQLQFFPVNLFGISIAHASLPTLAEQSLDNLGKFKRTFITSFHQMMFLVIPTSMILFILRVPVVRIVFGASTFPWDATVKTSYALAFYSLSIFAQSGIYMITRTFYALKDTQTPVKVSAITVILNVLFSLAFIKIFAFGVWSIALAFTITTIINFLIIFWLLLKKIDGIDYEELLKPFTKISFAALLMGVGLYIPLKLLDQFVFDTTRTLDLIILTTITTILGSLIYLGLTYIFKVEEITLLYKLSRKLNFKKSSAMAVTSTFGTHQEIEQ